MTTYNQQSESRHRYPGVKPFTGKERELFFGREKDIEEFYSLLYIKQSIVLYGKSGYGKSSLLNAGVIPRLEEEDEWCCYPIRFNNYSGRGEGANVSPMDNIRLRLKQGLSPEDTAFLDKIIPHEDSLWYWVKARQSAKGSSQFIFFFDQFEELFTYPGSNVEEFSDQLSHLLYNTVPAKFRKRLAEMDESDGISNELHNLLLEKPVVKVVFSVRSDRLSLLNGLKDKHPAILQHLYELDALTRAEAVDAIVSPARQPQSQGYSTPEFAYTDTAIGKILDNIANAQDGKIETSTLQIVCRYIEEELAGGRHCAVITVDQLGNIADIFKEYYEGVLAKLAEGDRAQARQLIEDELIEEGRRNTLTEGHIRRRLHIDEGLLLQLEQSSLLRKERDAAGRILYEISHDSLVNAIELVARRRRDEEEEIKRRKKLADEEEKQKILLARLMEEKENARKLNDLNRDLLELNGKVARRSRLAVGLAAVMLLLGVATGYLWIKERREANEAKNVSLFFFTGYLDRAKNLQHGAKVYMESTDYDVAGKNLRLADSLLKTLGSIREKVGENEKAALKEVTDSQMAISVRLSKFK